jgi:GNAT superfamily N-acetyltransferase
MRGMLIRRARPGDGEALARIHADMAAHYAELAPDRFRRPELAGYAAVLDADLAAEDDTSLDLVAEVRGEVVATLYARLVEPSEHARYAYAPDVEARRLRIEYLATLTEHRRTGAGTALVQAAEAWGREHGATVAETTTYHRGGISMPFWTRRAGYEERTLNLRKPL